ncbi:MAG: PIN domain-containing protein [Nanoarchaeota archaeon]|nr:PIN domain-containing protein [Nanoarchaeota archaeon]
MIALDTNAIIDIFKKDNKILSLINNLNEDLCSSIINYQEIMFGLNLENLKHITEENFYDNFFEGIFIFLLDISSSKKSTGILWNLKKEGRIVDKSDCMIAGILLANGVNKIITKNIKHFEHIPGLKVVSY